MLKPMTQKEVDLTVKNIVNAVKDIQKLNKRGYNYIYVASGFIAHYSLNGFKSHYSLGGCSMFTLRADLLHYQKDNQWKHFQKGDENFAYYQQKAVIYNKIINNIK